MFLTYYVIYLNINNIIINIMHKIIRKYSTQSHTNVKFV